MHKELDQLCIEMSKKSWDKISFLKMKPFPSFFSNSLIACWVSLNIFSLSATFAEAKYLKFKIFFFRTSIISNLYFYLSTDISSFGIGRRRSDFWKWYVGISDFCRNWYASPVRLWVLKINFSKTLPFQKLNFLKFFLNLKISTFSFAVSRIRPTPAAIPDASATFSAGFTLKLEKEVKFRGK